MEPRFLLLCRSLNANVGRRSPAEFRPDTRLVREDFARYYDEISRMDGVFGEVLAELEQRGLGTNTLVVFIGDNGASQLRGKGTLYEFGIHVPWLIRWPGVIKPGSASSNLISGEDLAPSLLEAAGRPGAKEHDRPELPEDAARRAI